jgi:pimeloyl-ACP methyl ester carboxylesterase
MGHSLGAVCGLVALEHYPDRFAGLLLLDPPLLSVKPVPDFSPDNLDRGIPLIRQSLGRRPHFPDRDSILARYRGRGVFTSFSEEDLAAYVDGAFTPDAHGLHLRCTPHWEAATFNGAMDDVDRWPGTLQRPFTLLAGETGSTVSDGTLARYAAHPLCHEARRLAGTDHFLPLQAPEQVRTSLLALTRT